MPSTQSLLARDDTLFGACQGLAEDFGFDPLFLRVPFAFLFFWSPAAALAGYAVLGALVATSRLIAPDPLPTLIEAPDRADPGERPDDPAEELPLAA